MGGGDDVGVGAAAGVSSCSCGGGRVVGVVEVKVAVAVAVQIANAIAEPTVDQAVNVGGELVCCIKVCVFFSGVASLPQSPAVECGRVEDFDT